LPLGIEFDMVDDSGRGANEGGREVLVSARPEQIEHVEVWNAPASLLTYGPR